jgi:HK97 gp10 family phage protein
MRVVNWKPIKEEELAAQALPTLKAAGEIVAADARRRVPVGKSRPAAKGGKDWTAREAGALKASIRVVTLNDNPMKGVRVYAGSHKVFYARFVEYGTVNMQAHPFLRPALMASKADILALFRGGH